MAKPEWSHSGGNIAEISSLARMTYLAGRFLAFHNILRRVHLVVLASNCAVFDTILRLLVAAIPIRVVARRIRTLLETLGW